MFRMHGHGWMGRYSKQKTGSNDTNLNSQIRFGGTDIDTESVSRKLAGILYQGMLSDADRQKIEGYLGKMGNLYGFGPSIYQ